MKKTLVLGDTHGRSNWKLAIHQEQPDRVIFIGDYFDSIYDTFKQYMGEWLVSKLTPLHADGWMSKLIMESIKDVDVSDFEKLLDCSFLTKSISKSIVDGSVGKLNKDNDLDGGLYDMVRNNIFDYVNGNDFLNKLESDITKILCPLLNGIVEKLETRRFNNAICRRNVRS